MITEEDFKKKGIKLGEETTPLDLLENFILNTNEVAEKLSDALPKGSKPISVSCAKQKLVRLEKGGFVERRKIDGLTYWKKVDQKK